MPPAGGRVDGCGWLWFIDAGSVKFVETPISRRYPTQDDRMKIAPDRGMGSRNPLKCTDFRDRRSTMSGCGVRLDDDQCAHRSVQPAPPVRLPTSGYGVRLVCADRPGGPGGSWPRRRRFHGPRAATSLRWMPRGRPRWAAAVWHRPPVRPMEGSRVATWCSWKHAVSQCWTGRTAPVCWRFWESLLDRGPSRRCLCRQGPGGTRFAAHMIVVPSEDRSKHHEPTQ